MNIGLYHILVSAKEEKISLLKERIEQKDEALREAKEQSPDALVERLGKRLKLSLEELQTLENDVTSAKGDIEAKSAELLSSQEKLKELLTILQESRSVCPKCGSPVIWQQGFTSGGFSSTPILGLDGQITHVDSNRIFRRYSCGSQFNNDWEVRPCGTSIETS